MLAAVTSGCSRTTGEDSANPVLRVGVLPDDSPEIIRQRHQPLLAYLQEKTGVRCELVVPTSYDDLLSRFRGDEIDLAYFGGYTFVAAHELAGALPLALPREGNRFLSYYIVPLQCSAQSLGEMKGARLAFGPRLSTSGHLMPRHFMIQEGIEPEQFFGAIRHTNSHDATIRAVRDGEADVGAVNAHIYHQMVRDGRIREGDLRILDVTPPYVDYVWACGADLPDTTRDDIRDAFLALSTEDDEHAAILRELDTEGFFPAGVDEFADTAAVIDRLNMLEELR